MADDEVHIVVARDIVLAVYRRGDSATLHARCITGATAVGPCKVLDQVPPEIVEDVESDFMWEDDQDTPVVDVTAEVLGSLADGSSRNRRAATEPGHSGGPRPPGSDRETGSD